MDANMTGKQSSYSCCRLYNTFSQTFTVYREFTSTLAFMIAHRPICMKQYSHCQTSETSDCPTHYSRFQVDLLTQVPTTFCIPMTLNPSTRFFRFTSLVLILNLMEESLVSPPLPRLTAPPFPRQRSLISLPSPLIHIRHKKIEP